ncbi:MAG: ComEC/Rec2 family competence protein [Arsenophonus endosymbiont of Dermacentor nuttalli]
MIYALTFGERGLLKPLLRQKLQRTGIVHLMAISSLHVGMGYFFGFWLYRLIQFLLPVCFIEPRMPMLVGWCCALGYFCLYGWVIPANAGYICLVVMALYSAAKFCLFSLAMGIMEYPV